MSITDQRSAKAGVSVDLGESRKTAWSYTMLLVFLYVINWGDKAVLGLVAQPLKEELGLSATDIGLVSSVFFLLFTIGGLFAGALNRWMPLRWSLLILCLLWTLSMIPVVIFATFAVLLISRAILGLAEGPSSALVHTGVYSWHPPEKRGFPSSVITSAASIAKIAVGPALALVIANQGWRAAFLILSGIGIVWSVIWVFTWRMGPYGDDVKKDVRPSRKRKSAAATPAAGNESLMPADAAVAEPEPAPAPRKSGYTGPDRVPWSRIFLTRTFVGGSIAIFAMYGLVTMVLTWLPSYFEVGLGYSRVQAGAMFGFPSIASMVFLYGSSIIGDRLLVRGASSHALRGILPSVGLTLCGLSLVTLPWIGAPALAVAVVSIGYGFGSVTFPLYNSGLSEICPPKQIAGALGIFLAIMALGGLLAPYVTGVIVDAAPDKAAGYATAFQVFGAVALIGGLFALFTVNPVRDRKIVLEQETQPVAH